MLLGCLCCFSCQSEKAAASHDTNVSGTLWVTGYLPGYRHTDSCIPFMTADDYEFLTHIIHHAGIPNADGSIDNDQNNMRPPARKMAVASAHAAGKPILYGVVGAYPVFNPVIANPETRRVFIHHLISTMIESGYDGIDLDMEPVCAPFGSFGYKGVDLSRHPEYKTEFPINHGYISLVKELRQELDRHSTPMQKRPLLTAAITWRDCHIFGRKEVHSHFDQINLMSYDMCGPQDGEVTWFDSPLANGGFTFPKYKKPAYSIEMFVYDCLRAGIPAKKLGIGISLDALAWKGGDGVSITSGVTKPRQSWTVAPIHPHDGAPRYTYAEMMENFFTPQFYHWDEIAKSPYLSIDLPGSSGDMFISYNDESSIKAKIEFVKNQKLGGCIIWELSADYRPDQPAEKQRPLRESIEEALTAGKEGSNKNE